MSSSLERKSKSDLNNGRNVEELLRTVANEINNINLATTTINITDDLNDFPNTRKKIKGIKRKSFRYTEPKKRRLFKRIKLQKKLNKGVFDYIEDDLNSGEYTPEKLEKMRFSEKRKDRKYYKKVQEYEDALYDVTTQKNWNRFKIGLATTALAGVIVLGGFLYKQILDTFASTVQAETSIAEMSKEEKIDLISLTNQLKQDIIKNVGYHFDNISEEEFMNGYLKIMNEEKRMSEQKIKGASIGMPEEGDQILIDSIVEEVFGEEYAGLTELQKRDYKQLAFELLSYALPEHFTNGGNPYLRSPIVMDELKARNVAAEKGYKIELVVNGDEKETVRNLGNILHIIKETSLSDYQLAASTENGQQELFNNILEEATGEQSSKLTGKTKRDYVQVIYEWLPEEAKSYIKDPIIVDRENKELEEKKDIGVGDER